MVFTQRPASNIRRLRSCIICCLSFIVVCGSRAAAASYNVNASIPFPAPTQAAVIASSLDNSTVQSALFTVSGSCQLVNPQAVVVIWRAGTAIGSAACDGSFTVQLMLTVGDNVLTARTASASGQYGPDSTPITVTLVLPPNNQPPAPSSSDSSTSENATPTAADNLTSEQTPSQTASQITSGNAAVTTDLTAVPTTPFSSMDSSQVVTIQTVITGGAKPYNLTLNWGDGTVESHSIDEPGTYEFSHTYSKAGSYTVHGIVRDVLGASTVFDYAVLTSFKTTGGAEQASRGGTIQQPETSWLPIAKTVALLVGSLLVASVGYIVGLRHAAKVMMRRRYATSLRATKKRRRQQR